MLHVGSDVLAAMIGHAYDCYPEEMCGLLSGTGDDAVTFHPCRNTTRSGRVFAIHPLDYQRAEDEADDAGQQLVAVVHSHTHTEPYPSPTDVGVADLLGPTLRWVIVGLKRESPEVRSYHIDGEIVAEEQLSVP